VGSSMACGRDPRLCRSLRLPADRYTPDQSISRATILFVRRELTCRFAVGRLEGPRGNVWRLWTRKSDVYISAWALTSVQKISLHESGRWRHAFTTEHVSRGSPFVASGADRVVEKWDRPPELASGVTKAFEIIVPASEVTTPKHPGAEAAFRKAFSRKEISWIDSPPQGREIHFMVVFTAPEVTDTTLPLSGWPARDSLGSRLIAYKELTNSQTVWLVAYETSTSEENQQLLAGFKQSVLPAFIEKMGRGAYAEILEPRMYLYGKNDQDGEVSSRVVDRPP
jgi:hypothetical protein